MKNDVDMSVYLEDSDRYADLVNVFGKLTKRKVGAEDVRPYETKLLYRIERQFRRMRFSKQRDTVRRVIFGVNFVVTEVELQEKIDYSYPLRDMGYTFGEYEQQARKIRKMVRRSKAVLTPGEYLYGFMKKSRLRPTVIFLLYFGVEEWDGPTCIHDMLDFTDVPEEMKRLVQNHCFLQVLFGKSCKIFLENVASPNWRKLQSLDWQLSCQPCRHCRPNLVVTA